MRAWIGGLIIAVLLSASGAAAQQRVLVLEGGTLIDGTGRAPIADSVVVAEGSRIKAVGTRGQVSYPANANVIRLTGRTILPGFIDSHLHTEDWHVPLFLHYGITTILSKVVDPAWQIAMRQGLAEGTIKGPRMFFTGTTIDGVAVAAGPNGPGVWNMHPVTTPEEMTTFARTIIANGAEAINTNQSISEAQLIALLAVGKEKGVPILGHVPNMCRAADLGMKYEEHLFMTGGCVLDPDNKTNVGLAASFDPMVLADPVKYPPVVDHLVKAGVYMNATLVGQWIAESPRAKEIVAESTAMAKDPQFAFIPQAVRDLWNRPSAPRRLGFANTSEFLRQFAAAGGKSIIGTDAGYRTIPGLSYHYELQMMVDVGMTPMQALQGATLWNAEVMLQAKDLGSVEVGKLADFVIIEGDPLKDISVTKNIRMVIKDGEVQDIKLNGNYVPPIPAPYSIYNLPQAITKITPAIVRKGGQTVTLEIEGTGFNANEAGFAANSIVRFDDVDLPTKFVSGSKLTATLDARLLQRGPGLYPVHIFSPGIYGTVSRQAYLVIDTADAPVSTIPMPYAAYTAARPIGPMPRMAPQGSKTLTVEIAAKPGSRFAPNAIVRFDNTDLPTKFVSSTRLSATLDGKLLQRTPGSYVFYVFTPGPFGTVSQPAYFQVGFKNSKMVWAEPLEPK